jgi:1-hydroxycarotenoid 3,4-desaturase
LSSDSRSHVIVIGAGMGGLSAALDLAASGLRVTVIERHPQPGGKMRELLVGDSAIDAGPTVFTMRRVFDELFEKCGRSLDDYVGLRQADILARHSWPDQSRLDLYADVEASAAAIREFSDEREADAYRRFARDSQDIFDTLDHSFMRVERPGPIGLTRSLGLGGVPRLVATKPFRSLWSELGSRFRDPRLQQLFGRYATYCGSSPFDSPATLMLIAHAERAGVWYIDGGMRRLADAFVRLLGELGVELRFDSHVTAIEVGRGTVSAVEVNGDTRIEADAVVFNGDAAALTAGLLGDAVREAQADRTREQRSLSAITWCLNTETSGFLLHHHNVFFGSDYADEFASIFERNSTTREPTVYICAQDRGRDGDAARKGTERLLMLINAPPVPMAAAHVQRAGDDAFEMLARQGLHIDADAATVTSPADFAELFPGSDGAIYGWPTHGWYGSFRRAGSVTRIPGLYLAGGSVHPGPGVPMVATSGRVAAASVRRYVEQRAN